MTALLEARGVGKRFGGGPLAGSGMVALSGVSLALHAERPAITAVVGESGSGKTTLARVLLGLTAPTEGQVLYKGQDLATLTGEARRAFRRDVQAVFQDPCEVYNPFSRVAHVLTTPVRKFRLAASRAEGRLMIEDSLRAVGLRPEEILGRFPHQLSGGQRQRIMVARAVLMRPRVIVADEPVSMVDASLRATILGSLRKLTDERGIVLPLAQEDVHRARDLLVPAPHRLQPQGARVGSQVAREAVESRRVGLGAGHAGKANEERATRNVKSLPSTWRSRPSVRDTSRALSPCA